MANITINGCNYYYEILGKGKETILFAHGLLMTHQAFDKQVDYFKSRYQIMVFDQRGHGQTEFAKSGYDMDSLAEDVIQLIEVTQIGKVHFVGHSMGGFIGLRVTARRPDIIKTLTLLNTSAEAEHNIFRYQMLKYLALIFGVKQISKPVHNLNFGRKFRKDPTRKADYDFWYDHLSSQSPDMTMIADEAVYRQSVENELFKISCPTLIISGSEDHILHPKHSQFMAKKLTHAHLEILPEIGHCACIEAPDKINQLMEDFLQSAK